MSSLLHQILQILSLLLLGMMAVKAFGYIVIIILAKNKTKENKNNTVIGRIDIVISAFNEEDVIIGTINNLLNIDYPEFRIIVIDDGSTDNTLDLLKKNYRHHPQIKILSKDNKGKAVALNHALTYSDSEVVAFVDADTYVKRNFLTLVSSSFEDERAIAMAGYLRVRNLTNCLTIGQDAEYITALNLERETFEKINTLTTIPGAVCAYRKDFLQNLGGFRNKTLTEDCDLTLKILNANLKVNNERRAIAYTEAPETIRMFIRQRIRWDYGLMQNLIIHCSQTPITNFKLWIVYIYSWLFKILYVILFVLGDYFLLASMVSGAEISSYYVFFLSFETLYFVIILIGQNEKFDLRKLQLLPYRVVYRQLRFFSLFSAIYRLVKNKKLEWKKVQRLSSRAIQKQKF